MLLGKFREMPLSIVEDLRALIHHSAPTSDREKHECSIWPEGFVRGTLNELTGFGKTGVMAQFLAENKKLRVAWIEEALSINPCALGQKKASLPRLLFVEAKNQTVWTALQVLKSHLFDCVVICLNKLFDENNLRRLQLAAEKANAVAFLLTEQSRSAWPISLQIKIVRQNHNLFLKKV